MPSPADLKSRLAAWRDGGIAIFVVALIPVISAFLLGETWDQMATLRKPVFKVGKVMESRLAGKGKFAEIKASMEDGSYAQLIAPTGHYLPGDVFTAVTTNRIGQYFWLGKGQIIKPTMMRLLWSLKWGLIGLSVYFGIILWGLRLQLRLALPIWKGHVRSGFLVPVGSGWERSARVATATEHLVFHLLLFACWNLGLWYLFRVLEDTTGDAIMRRGFLLVGLLVLFLSPVSYWVHQMAEWTRQNVNAGHALTLAKALLVSGTMLLAAYTTLFHDKFDWYSTTHIQDAIRRLIATLMGI